MEVQLFVESMSGWDAHTSLHVHDTVHTHSAASFGDGSRKDLSCQAPTAMVGRIQTFLPLFLPVLQNPVTAVAWFVADISLLGPLVSLTIETMDFCEGLFRTKVTMLFALAHGITATITLLVPDQRHVAGMSAYLKLYNFNAAFRLKFAGLIVGKCIQAVSKQVAAKQSAASIEFCPPVL